MASPRIPSVVTVDAHLLGDLDVTLEQTAAETALEDGLLEEFYAFTFEDAVLVGPPVTGTTGTMTGSSSPPRLTQQQKHSPLRRPPSPTRNTAAAAPACATGSSGSPSKQLGSGSSSEATGSHSSTGSTGPTAAHVVPSAEALLTREVMNAILGPKTWRDANGKWQRMVKITPSTRTDVQRLRDIFGQLLEEHQARASAICPVREKMFLHVFEELIRQCACECPERGLLLLRLRDELRMTMEGYQTLYHNSIAYGRQKAVQAEAGIGELEERIQQLQCARAELQDRKQRLTHRLTFVEAYVAEDKQKRELHQQQRVQFLRNQQEELSGFHEQLTEEPTWK